MSIKQDGISFPKFLNKALTGSQCGTKSLFLFIMILSQKRFLFVIIFEGDNIGVETDRNKNFNSFYKSYFRKIFRYCYYLIGNYEEAEQLTQETFIKLFGYFLSDTPIKSHKALAYLIASNSCVDHLRRKRRFKEIMNKMNNVNSSQDDPSQKILKEQKISLVRQALLKLPSRDQKCLILYQEGFAYSEIAEVMKIKKTSIGKILSRATEKLADQIRKGEKQ
jgi:RNA polymerase sigma-70 factor (ECF subfamily)